MLKLRDGTAVLFKAAPAVDGKITVKDFRRHVPNYIPKIFQQSKLTEHIKPGVPTEKAYIQKSAFMKDVNQQIK